MARAATAASASGALAAANEHVALANRAFQSGHYDKAIDELRIAYRLAPRAEFLLSFAQVYRAAGRLQEALEACHAYLDIVPRGRLADDTRELVKLLEAELARAHRPSSSSSPAPPPEPQSRAPSPEPAPSPRVEPPGPALAPLVAAPAEAPKPRRRGWLLGLTLGAGAVVIGLTVGLAVGLTREARHPSLGTIDFTPP
jgi:tetratricopeptide (TPR) repeat protein